MNLPLLNEIQTNRSTYYTFSKANKDFDRSVINNTKFYYSKLVALKIPIWSIADMFFNWSVYDAVNNVDGNIRFYPSVHIPDALTSPDNLNPNKVIAKLFQFYTENIIRHTNIADNGDDVQEVAELAFWKTLKQMGVSDDYIRNDCVKFINRINTSNFYNVSNNHGWAEIVGAIPNKCLHLDMSVTGVWKNLTGVDDIVNAEYIDDSCLYDNGDLQFDFVGNKKVLDFDFIDVANNSNGVFNDTDVVDFDFNVLLLYYKDSDGIDKLHGINFIGPYQQENVSNYHMTNYNHKSNEIQTFGYTFRFNMKSNNNQQTTSEVYDAQEGSFYNEFGETLGKLNSFLAQAINE